jgi:hypothetical protein
MARTFSALSLPSTQGHTHDEVSRLRVDMSWTIARDALIAQTALIEGVAEGGTGEIVRRTYPTVVHDHLIAVYGNLRRVRPARFARVFFGATVWTT